MKRLAKNLIDNPERTLKITRHDSMIKPTTAHPQGHQAFFKIIYTILTLNLYKYFHNCLIEMFLCVLERLLYIETDEIKKNILYHIIKCINID